MKDSSKTKQELIEELSFLNRQTLVRMDNVLNRLILIISVLSGIGLIATPFIYEKKMGSIVFILVLLMTMICAKLLMRHGQVRLSGIYTISSLWIIFAFLILIGGGLDNINVVFFISLAVMAGLLFGERATIMFAGAGITMGFVLALMAISGYLPSRYFLSSPFGDWAQLVFALVLTASTLNIALRDRNNALKMANKQLSDRLEAEHALRESEEIYTKIIAAMPDVMLRMNLKGEILLINDVALSLSKYQRKEMIGQNMLSFIAPEDQDRAAQNTLLMFERKLGPQEYHLIMKDGRKLLFEVNGDVLRNEDGSPFGFVHVCRDITLRKQTEEALRESENKFRKMTEASTIGISITDGQRFLYGNPMVLKMSGYSEEEYLSKPMLDFITPESRELIRQRAMDRLAGKTVPDHFEMQVLTKDGRIRWADVGAALIEYNGKPASIFTQYDITDRKKAEAEKESLQAQLLRAQKMEALGQLAGGVAHDLNNVLGILSGYSELLLMEIPEGQRARGHVEKIFQSTEKGAAIIQDLLTLARRGVTVSDVINLNNVVADFLTTPVFEKTKDFHPRVTFRTDCQEELLNIKGSPMHLEKTLMNLVSNAAESISGVGEVTIRTQSRYLDTPVRGYDEIKEGDYTILTVSDTGMGIPAEHREKIFEPFYTKKTMGRSGTGLGLAIVWGTIKDHNGYIDVQTEVGEGTTFTLYFPVTREELLTPQQKVPIEKYLGNGESVLVVDDIAEQREVASGLLKKLGYEVQALSSGEEAVEYLRVNKADIIVLDMIMAPGIDGLETYQRILRINPQQKAILVSGFSETDRVKRAQKLGAGAYVKKPYVLERIGVAIRDELKR